MTRAAGAVLVGGVSRRMGRDKPTLPLPGGRLLGQVAVDALLRAGVSGVVAVGRIEAVLGVPALPDAHPGVGPLGGLVTALEAAKAEVVVVLSCDLPAITPAAVGEVLAGLGLDDDASLASAGGRLHPLLAAYRRSAAPALAAALADGERRLLTALAPLRVAVVELTDPAAATNVNTSGELAAFVRSGSGCARAEGDEQALGAASPTRAVDAQLGQTSPFVGAPGLGQPRAGPP